MACRGKLEAVRDDPKLLRPLGIAVVIAAAVLFADLFGPFAMQGCISCPLAGPGATLVLPSFSLMEGLDGNLARSDARAKVFEIRGFLAGQSD